MPHRRGAVTFENVSLLLRGPVAPVQLYIKALCAWLVVCGVGADITKWNAVVELLPLWLAPNMVTLIGFFFVLGNLVLLEIFVPDLVGPVRPCHDLCAILTKNRRRVGFTTALELAFGCEWPRLKSWMLTGQVFYHGQRGRETGQTDRHVQWTGRAF